MTYLFDGYQTGYSSCLKEADPYWFSGPKIKVKLLIFILRVIHWMAYNPFPW